MQLVLVTHALGWSRWSQSPHRSFSRLRASRRATTAGTPVGHKRRVSGTPSPSRSPREGSTMRASNHPGSGNDDEEYENVLSVLIVDDDASRGGDGPPKRKRAGRVALGNRAALKRQVGLLRSQGRRQIGLRVCQTVSYVLAALCVLGGVIAIHMAFTQLNKDMEQGNKMAARLAPAIPQATQTVRTINQALGPIVAAIGTIKDVTGGVTNVLQEVKVREHAPFPSHFLSWHVRACTLAHLPTTISPSPFESILALSDSPTFAPAPHRPPSLLARASHFRPPSSFSFCLCFRRTACPQLS